MNADFPTLADPCKSTKLEFHICSSQTTKEENQILYDIGNVK